PSAPVIAPSASLQGIAPRGAAGLWATATADARGGDAPLAPVVTLSAGAPAVGPVGGGRITTFQAGPPGAPTRFGTVGQVYRTRTGLEPAGAWVYPDVALVDRLNAEPTVGVSPGLLAETPR